MQPLCSTYTVCCKLHLTYWQYSSQQGIYSAHNPTNHTEPYSMFRHFSTHQTFVTSHYYSGLYFWRLNCISFVISFQVSLLFPSFSIYSCRFKAKIHALTILYFTWSNDLTTSWDNSPPVALQAYFYIWSEITMHGRMTKNGFNLTFNQWSKK